MNKRRDEELIAALQAYRLNLTRMLQKIDILIEVIQDRETNVHPSIVTKNLDDWRERRIALGDREV